LIELVETKLVWETNSNEKWVECQQRQLEIFPDGAKNKHKQLEGTNEHLKLKQF
jgi:hypothetical protein